MIHELGTVLRSIDEVYEALYAVLAEIPDTRLDWKPSPSANSPGILAQHIARANTTYANLMQTGERGFRSDLVEGLPRDAILKRLDASRDLVHNVFDTLPVERLHARCADDWAGLGPTVEGPLDALWFAQLMVSHSAYHVGQINYIAVLLETAEER